MIFIMEGLNIKKETNLSTHRLKPLNQLVQSDPEIAKIAVNLHEWEAYIHGQPLDRYDIHKFLLWFTQNIDQTISADQIKDYVWRIKGFTSKSQEDDDNRILEKDGFVKVHQTSITFLNKEIPVEVWEQREE